MLEITHGYVLVLAYGFTRDGDLQEFIIERLAEQKASLETGAAALKSECEEIMSDIRSSRCDYL